MFDYFQALIFIILDVHCQSASYTLCLTVPVLQEHFHFHIHKIIANYYHYCFILIAVQALNDCDESNQAVVCTDVMLLKSVF